MLDLFNRSECGYVDLYYNDAICLKKSITSLSENANKLEVDIDDELMNQLLMGSINKYEEELNSEVKLLNLKFILFELSCSNPIENALILKYQQ
jgi:hypothetical protein